MKRTTLCLIVCTLALAGTAYAQQAGENINVLPVVPQNVTDWEIKGDGYLQRQVEPTIAASTLNPDHLLAFFNDYRAVDIDDDTYVGEEQFQVASLAINAAEFMLAGIIPRLGIPVIEPPPVAAAEAWVGMSRSYDGGLTWAGGFLPGADFDTSTASLASPVWGLEAATDPVLAPAPCGYFYLVFVAFTRGGESKLAVARYQDLNNDEGGDTIEYLGTTVIETGNNADNGHFLDKPDIEVDVWRGDGGPSAVRPPCLRQLQHLRRPRQVREVPEQGQLRQVGGLRPDLLDRKDQQDVEPEPGLDDRNRPRCRSSGQRRRPRHNLRRVAALLRSRRHHHQEVGRLRRQLGQPGGGQQPADGTVRPANDIDRGIVTDESRSPQLPVQRLPNSHGGDSK